MIFWDFFDSELSYKNVELCLYEYNFCLIKYSKII